MNIWLWPFQFYFHLLGSQWLEWNEHHISQGTIKDTCNLHQEFRIKIKLWTIWQLMTPKVIYQYLRKAQTQKNKLSIFKAQCIISLSGQLIKTSLFRLTSTNTIVKIFSGVFCPTVFSNYKKKTKKFKDIVKLSKLSRVKHLILILIHEWTRVDTGFF